jgi:hypothetical protein
MTRLHWERRGRFLDLCDGDELLASIETRRYHRSVTTYHWVITGRSKPIAGMTTNLDDAKRTVLAYL